MSVNLSGLPNYVDQNSIELIRKSVLSARTIDYVKLQTGVVGPTSVNVLNTNIVFGDGASCGWNEAGESVVSQRVITPALLKVNMAFCNKQMAKTFMAHQVNVAAGRETLPFEETFTGDVVARVSEKLDEIIWQGTTINGTKYNGFLDLLDGAVEAETGDTVYTSVKNVYKAMPNVENAVIFIGVDKFRDLALELTEKNLYHYNPTVDEAYTMILPGTTCKVIGVGGLNETEKAVAANPDYMFYGTDMTGDEETFKLWYSDDNQEFRLNINFSAGVQFAFPDQVAYVSL